MTMMQTSLRLLRGRNAWSARVVALVALLGVEWPFVPGGPLAQSDHVVIADSTTMGNDPCLWMRPSKVEVEESDDFSLEAVRKYPSYFTILDDDPEHLVARVAN